MSDSSEKKDPKEEDSSKLTEEVSGYVKYTNIIYLMLGAIAAAFAAGYLLDKIFNLSFPIFKLIFGFGGVIIALYLMFKQLNRK